MSLWGSSIGNIYLIGERVWLRYDGKRWHIISVSGGLEPDRNSYIWGLSEQDFYIVGEGESVLKYRPKK